MHVIAIQLDIVWEDADANFDKVRMLLEQSGVPAGSLIVLPEAFAVGFTMNPEAAEPPGWPTEQFLVSLAKKHKAYVLAGVICKQTGGLPSNEAIIVEPSGYIPIRYSKLHPFSLVREQDHHAPGDDVCVFQCGGFTAAPFVCYDLRFPEVFRIAIHRGVNLFVVIANWPKPRADHWTSLLKARAIENQAYVIGVNRCGSDEKNEYAGGSVVFGPRGEVVVEAGDTECVFEADLDLQSLVTYRDEFPALRDIKY